MKLNKNVAGHSQRGIEMKHLYFLVTLLAVAGTIQAQGVDGFFSIGSGLKVVNEEAAIGLDGKFTLVHRSFYANINALDFAFVPLGPKEGYKRETTSSGTTICRDTSNGQFANSENCATQFRTLYAFSTDLNYVLSPEGVKFIFGLGYRLSSDPTPYFNAHVLFKENSFDLSQYWYGNFMVGSKFIKVGVGIAFQL